MINKARHYFARSIVSENISKQDQDLNDFLQKNFEKLDLKLKGVSSNNSQVSTTFYSTKTKPPSTHRLKKKKRPNPDLQLLLIFKSLLFIVN